MRRKAAFLAITSARTARRAVCSNSGCQQGRDEMRGANPDGSRPYSGPMASGATGLNAAPFQRVEPAKLSERIPVMEHR